MRVVRNRASIREAIRRVIESVGGADSAQPRLLEPQRFRRQRTIIVLLSMGTLAALFLIHLLFIPIRGVPSPGVLCIIGAAFVVHWAELLRLRTLPLSMRAAAAHTRGWVIFLFVLCAVLAFASPLQDTEYCVLLLLPLISLAFRCRLRTAMAAAVGCCVITFVPLLLHFYLHPPVRRGNLFDASILSVSYLLVAAAVWAMGARLRLEQQRQASQEKLAAVGRLAARIAHEIRNPVAMIASSLAAAEQPGASAAMRAEMLGIALQESGRLERLTDDFLSYARRKPPQISRVNVAGLLRYVAGVASARATQNGLSIDVQSPPDLEADVDEFQIHGALLNLLTNAMDASGPGTSIELGGRESDGVIELTVENTADPIPPEVVERLFEPFFTTKPSGTGLGLPIARNIAAAHGGELALICNRPGHIRFALTMPTHQDGRRSDCDVAHSDR